MELRCHNLLVASVLGAMLACAGAGTRPPRPIANDVGTYRFEERVPSGEGGSAIVIQGVFTVRPDTIVVDATPGPCRYNRRSTLAGALAYDCADITLRFDRDDPVGRSTYSVMVTVLEERTICVRYTTNSGGQQVCAQTRRETVEHRVSRSGRLNARRVE